ncbi:MAG: methyl-accepting chemotaxis protein [Thermoanaerobaculia bacterium]
MTPRDEPERLVLTVSLAAGGVAFGAGAAASLVAAWAAAGFGNPLERVVVLDLGLAASAAAGLVAAVAVASLLQRPVARLARILDSARQMAEGNLATRAPEGSDLAGGVGRLLNAVAGRGAHLLSSVRREHAQLNRQVSVLRAASIRNRERAAHERERLASATAAVGGLDGTIRAIAGSVETLAAGSEETASAVAEVDGSLSNLLARSEGLLAGSTEGAAAAVSLAEGAAVLDGTLTALAKRAGELAEAARRTEAALGSVLGSAREASEQAAQAATEARAGRAVVEEARVSVTAIRSSAGTVREAVRRVEARSREVGRILEMLEEIARQTNLLALNASLLATRAGEHGRGFSVVASEIRRLSDRTSEGARGIGGHVSGMRDEVEAALAAAEEEGRLVTRGVETATRAGEALASIEAAAARAEGAVAAIRAVAQAQSDAVAGTAASVAEVREGLRALTEEGQRNTREAERIRELVGRVRDLAGFVERTVQEQKGAAGQIAVAAERSLGLMRDIQDSVGRQTADSHRLLGLLSEVEAMSRETVASASSVEDATAALETLAGSLEDEVGRFRVETELRAT